MKRFARTPLVAAMLALAGAAAFASPKKPAKTYDPKRMADAEAKRARKNAARAARHHGGRP